MAYVDGFVVPVPQGNRDAYRALAVQASAIFKKNGALQLVECWEDDVPDGKLTDFRRAVQAEPGEAVVFSWILWPSREARDAGNAAVMTEMQAALDAMPFDGKRMIWGGFTTLFDSEAQP